MSKNDDILNELNNLLEQATKERSHHYVGHVILKAYAEIVKLRLEAMSANRSPTQFAYDAACKALEHWRQEARRLAKLAKTEPRGMDWKHEELQSDADWEQARPQPGSTVQNGRGRAQRKRS